MKFGFLSAILPEYTLEQVVDFAAENGFGYIEVACWPQGKADRRYAGVTHIDMEGLTDEKAASINEYLKEKQVGISAIGYYPNVLSDDPEVRETARKHLKACVLGAEKLGVEMVNTFIGRNRRQPMDVNIAEFKEFWPGMIAFAADHGVKIAIENCPMYFWDEWPNGDNLACSPEFWRFMFQEITNDFFGLNYDPAHLVWQRMDYVKPIYEFKDKLFHFHVKDAKFYQDKFDEVGMFAPPLKYHNPKLPGQGDIQWGKVVSALNDIRYKGAFMLEIEDKAYEETLEDRLESILQAKEYISQFIRK